MIFFRPLGALSAAVWTPFFTFNFSCASHTLAEGAVEVDAGAVMAVTVVESAYALNTLVAVGKPVI